MSFNHIVVLVFGDVGRSPRMQFHARSFASLPSIHRVTMIGYEGEKPMQDLQSNTKVNFHYISSIDLPAIRFISFIRAILKGVLLLFSIFTCLWSIPRYQLIVIQNPPCLPAVIVAYFFSLFNNSKILIDWHNLGFSIYENAIGRKTSLVKFTYQLEKYLCGHCAHLHICVSKALQSWLKENFGINATVLYDRPGNIISESNFSIKDRQQLLTKLELSDEKIFNLKSQQLKGRTALVISSTSWTADEDFSILLQTMEDLEKFLQDNQSNSVYLEWPFQRVLCMITGKGELKAFYEVKIAAFNDKSRFVKLKTLWLEYADYPKLLNCSHVGVSLHTSTSGLDLPMKILDMFGSSLPVFAINFSTIEELVTIGKNGLIFNSQKELTQLFMKTLFSNLVEEKQLLSQLRINCSKIENWETNWSRTMPGVVSHLFPNNL